MPQSIAVLFQEGYVHRREISVSLNNNSWSVKIMQCIYMAWKLKPIPCTEIVIDISLSTTRPPAFSAPAFSVNPLQSSDINQWQHNAQSTESMRRPAFGLAFNAVDWCGPKISKWISKKSRRNVTATCIPFNWWSLMVAEHGAIRQIITSYYGRPM